MIVMVNKRHLSDVYERYANYVLWNLVWQKDPFLCVGIRIETHRKSIEWGEMER